MDTNENFSDIKNEIEIIDVDDKLINFKLLLC